MRQRSRYVRFVRSPCIRFTREKSHLPIFAILWGPISAPWLRAWRRRGNDKIEILSPILPVAIAKNWSAIAVSWHRHSRSLLTMEFFLECGVTNHQRIKSPWGCKQLHGTFFSKPPLCHRCNTVGYFYEFWSHPKLLLLKEFFK